jgi:LDH2 family malate/lactate/ureidoglycolate dehydrogenase
MSQAPEPESGRQRLVRLPLEAAFELARAALRASGATDEVATCVAEHVVDAERAGHPSHGLRQVPGYCARAGQPGCDLTVSPAVVARRGAVTHIDGRCGLGHPALRLAVDCALEAARAHGVGAAGVIRCGHAGRAGAWVERGTAAGAVTLVLLGGAVPPFVVTYGSGSDPVVHTNPIAIGAPGQDTPLLLDMASSVIAAGKVAIARSRGEALPEGAILDAHGQPSVDPNAFYAGGALLPVGGHKGFGLSVLVEALTVCLTGADATELAEGALVVCLDATTFREEAAVVESIESLRRRLHASGRTRAVLAPGEPEARSRAATTEVAIEEDVVVTLRRLGVG